MPNQPHCTGKSISFRDEKCENLWASSSVHQGSHHLESEQPDAHNDFGERKKSVELWPDFATFGGGDQSWALLAPLPPSMAATKVGRFWHPCHLWERWPKLGASGTLSSNLGNLDKNLKCTSSLLEILKIFDRGTRFEDRVPKASNFGRRSRRWQGCQKHPTLVVALEGGKVRSELDGLFPIAEIVVGVWLFTL